MNFLVSKFAPQPENDTDQVSFGYKPLNPIETHGYGPVRLLHNPQTNHFMLLKEFSFDDKKAFQNECKLLKARSNLNHPNLTKIFGYNIRETKEQNKISIFTEEANVDLFTELKDRIKSNIEYTENELFLIMENLISALNYLHSNSIPHRDIRPSTIFISNGEYKLSDARLFIGKESHALNKAVSKNIKTLLAPEYIAKISRGEIGSGEDEYRADIFSLGVTLLSLATLTNPEDLYDYKRGAFIEELLQERIEEITSRYSDFVAEIVGEMVSIQSERRASASELWRKLGPYSKDIKKGVDLGFFKTKTWKIDINYLDLTSKNDIIGIEREGYKMNYEVDSRKSLEESVRKLVEPYSSSSYGGGASQLKQSKSQDILEGTYSRSSIYTGDVDAKVKMALERSQAIFKQIYGGDSHHQHSGSATLQVPEDEKAKRNPFLSASAVLGGGSESHNVSLISPSKDFYLMSDQKYSVNNKYQTPLNENKLQQQSPVPHNLATSYLVDESKIQLDESVRKTIENIKSARSGYINSPYSPNVNLSASVQYSSDLKRPPEVEEILKSIKIDSLTKSALKVDHQSKDEIQSAPLHSSYLKYTPTAGITSTTYDDLKRSYGGEDIKRSYVADDLIRKKESEARIEEEVQKILKQSFYKHVHTSPPTTIVPTVVTQQDKGSFTAIESQYNEGPSGFDYTLGRSSLGELKESSHEKRYSRPQQLSHEGTPSGSFIAKPSFESNNIVVQNYLRSSFGEGTKDLKSPEQVKSFYKEERSELYTSPSPSKVLFGAGRGEIEATGRSHGGSEKHLENSPVVQGILGNSRIGEVGEIGGNEQEQEEQQEEEEYYEDHHHHYQYQPHYEQHHQHQEVNYEEEYVEEMISPRFEMGSPQIKEVAEHEEDNSEFDHHSDVEEN